MINKGVVFYIYIYIYIVVFCTFRVEPLRLADLSPVWLVPEAQFDDVIALLFLEHII